MKKKFEVMENEVKKLFSEMKIESGRIYLWENVKDLDNKFVDMICIYCNIEKIVEVMKYFKIILNIDQNKNKVKDVFEWLYKNVYGKELGKKVKELSENFIKIIGKNINLNWWDYEIGIFKLLINIFIFLKEDFIDEEKKKYIVFIKIFVLKSDEILFFVGKVEFVKGGNLVDIFKVKFLESIIEEDVIMMKNLIDGFNKVFIYV